MQPSYYAEGTTPRLTDTRLRIYTKILGKYQNAAGADAANNPRRTDTLYQIKKKLERAMNAI